MSSQTLPRSQRTGQRRKKKTNNRLIWWPLVLGVAITYLSVKAAEILPLTGPDGILKLQLLYPIALLLKQPQPGIPELTAESLSQVMLYAQYPLYGLYIMVAARWKSIGKALLHVFFFHIAGFVALWLLARK